MCIKHHIGRAGTTHPFCCLPFELRDAGQASEMTWQKGDLGHSYGISKLGKTMALGGARLNGGLPRGGGDNVLASLN